MPFKVRRFTRRSNAASTSVFIQLRTESPTPSTHPSAPSSSPALPRHYPDLLASQHRPEPFPVLFCAGKGRTTFQSSHTSKLSHSPGGGSIWATLSTHRHSCPPPDRAVHIDLFCVINCFKNLVKATFSHPRKMGK